MIKYHTISKSYIDSKASQVLFHTLVASGTKRTYSMWPALFVTIQIIMHLICGIFS